jgi:hypothetical protein
VLKALTLIVRGSAAGLLWALAGAASAHHSFAMFDQTKQVTISGTVKEFQWSNPHAFIEMLDPQQKTWSIELNSPNNLIRQGWKRTVLKPGDKVSVVMNPLRNGLPGGLFNAVTLPDGKVLGNPRPTGPINVPEAP